MLLYNLNPKNSFLCYRFLLQTNITQKLRQIVHFRHHNLGLWKNIHEFVGLEKGVLVVESAHFNMFFLPLLPYNPWNIPRFMYECKNTQSTQHAAYLSSPNNYSFPSLFVTCFFSISACDIFIRSTYNKCALTKKI